MRVTYHDCVWGSRIFWAGQQRSCPPDTDSHRIDGHIPFFCHCQTSPALPWPQEAYDRLLADIEATR